MLLGIVLHAAITYMVAPMEGLLWPLSDQPRHFGFDALFWWIHGWRIPLFFVMAGFFAAMLARRRGPSGFIKHRIDRILIPVAIALVTILPVVYCIWAWGWMIEHRVFWEEVWQFDFRDTGIERNFMGTGHLWFLNYLMLFSVVYWFVLKRRGSRPEDDEPTLGPARTWCFTTGFRPIVFAVPTALMLWAQPGFYIAYHHAIPLSLAQAGYELGQMVYQGYFFAVGVYLFRLHREMDAIKRYAWLYLALAQLVFLVCLLMKLPNWGWEGSITASSSSAYRLAFAVSVALFGWLMIWGLTGLGLTLLAKPRAVMRWLSDSAYWVYLVHLPIVGFLMVTIEDWIIPHWAKFLLIVTVTSILTLVSYQWLVRYTIIGNWLNGPRSRPGG